MAGDFSPEILPSASTKTVKTKRFVTATDCCASWCRWLWRMAPRIAGWRQGPSMAMTPWRVGPPVGSRAFLDDDVGDVGRNDPGWKLKQDVRTLRARIFKHGHRVEDHLSTQLLNIHLSSEIMEELGLTDRLSDVAAAREKGNVSFEVRAQTCVVWLYLSLKRICIHNTVTYHTYHLCRIKSVISAKHCKTCIVIFHTVQESWSLIAFNWQANSAMFHVTHNLAE